MLIWKYYVDNIDADNYDHERNVDGVDNSDVSITMVMKMSTMLIVMTMIMTKMTLMKHDEGYEDEDDANLYKYCDVDKVDGDDDADNCDDHERNVNGVVENGDDVDNDVDDDVDDN